jgi:hypothetical protein
MGRLKAAPTYRYNIVTHMTVARRRFGKYILEVTLSTVGGYPVARHVSVTTNRHTVIEELLELVISIQFTQKF